MNFVRIFSALEIRAKGLEMYRKYNGACRCSKPFFGIVVVIQANSVRTYKLLCVGCGRLCSNAIPASKLPDWVLSNAPVYRDHMDQTTLCARCGSNDGVEMHHWAPRSVFDDADEWPVALLCPRCHSRWHEAMNGYHWSSSRRRA